VVSGLTPGTTGFIPDATQVQAAYHVVNAGAYWKHATLTCRLFVDNLRRFLDNEPLKEVVDRVAGY